MKSNKAVNLPHADAARRCWPGEDAAESLSLAAILQAFGLTFSQLAAYEVSSDGRRVTWEAQSVNARPLVTVDDLGDEGGWRMRLMHSVNPFGDPVKEARGGTDYETVNQYRADGRHTRLTRLRQKNDRLMLEAHAHSLMQRQPDAPCRWVREC